MPATISVNFATQAEVQQNNPPENRSVSARVLKDVLSSGGVAGGYVTLAGAQTISGAKTFSATLTTATINSSSTYQIGGVNRLYGTTQDPYANIRVVQNLTTSTAAGMRGMYINFDSTGGTAADCRFYANGQNQRMIIKADTGRVGIGTSAPSSLLHVNGEMMATNVNVGGATASIGRVQLIQGNATNPGYVAWFRPDGTTRIAYQGFGSPGGANHLTLNLENSANFKTFNGQVIVHPPGSGDNTILKPTAWTGGISSLDIYATGSVGAGPSNSSSGAFAFMNSSGRLSIRAAATASAATQIPVFTANPASTTREIATRTPAQLLADMGGLTTGGTATAAARLSPGANINGTLFVGNVAITTANWGTTRAISIGGTSKNVNGGGNVTWSIAEIGGNNASNLTTGTLPIARIANGAVTNAKLASGIDAGKLTTGTLPSARIANNAIALNQLSLGSNFPIQVVQVVKSNIQLTSTTATWEDIAGLSLTLTRRIASNAGAVRIQAVIHNSTNNSFHGVHFRIVRGSTVIGIANAAGTRNRTTAVSQYPNSSLGMNSTTIDFVDNSPGSGSTVTYKIQAWTQSTVIGYINRVNSDSDGIQYGRAISTLTLTELTP